MPYGINYKQIAALIGIMFVVKPERAVPGLFYLDIVTYAEKLLHPH